MADPKPVEIHITPSNNEELTAHEVATALHKKLLLDTEMTKMGIRLTHQAPTCCAFVTSLTPAWTIRWSVTGSTATACCANR